MRTVALAAWLAIVVPAAAHAAWPSNPTQNLPICTANRTQWENLVVSDGAGGAIMMWYDERDSPPDRSNGGIYAQRVDPSGTLLWAPNGVAVLPGAIDYLNLDAACTDGAGGAIIAWVNSTQGEIVHVQHLDANGLVTWGPDGIVVGTGATYAGVCGLVSDGMGGAVVVWRSQEGQVYGMRAQRFASDGAPIWTPGGVVIRAAGTAYPSPPLVVPDGQSGALALWKETASDGTWTILFQHVKALGLIEAGSGGRTVRAGLTGSPAMASWPDGVQGAFVTWTEDDGQSTSRVYAQRLSPGGDLLWVLPGVALGGSISAYYGPALAFGPSDSGDVIAAWNQAGSGFWVRAQRLNTEGAMLWPAGGVQVSRAVTGGIIGSIGLSSDGSGGALIAYAEDKPEPSPSYYYFWDITASRVTASGDAPWSETGTPVCTANDHQTSPAVVAGVPGMAIVCWTDARWGYGSARGDDIYAQNLFADGTIGDGVTSVGHAAAASWARVWPVPARGRVDLAFTSAGGTAAVTLFDLDGRAVRELLRGPVPAGEMRLHWDRLDSSGRPVASGLYFARIAAAGREIVRRVVLER